MRIALHDFERIESNGVPAAAEEEHIKESTYLKLELRNILSMSKILKTCIVCVSAL